MSDSESETSELTSILQKDEGKPASEDQSDEKCEKHLEATRFQKSVSIAAAVATVVLTVTTETTVQLLQRTIPDFELNGLRCLAPLLWNFTRIAYTREWPVIPRTELLAALGFVVTGFIFVVATYAAVTFAPVSSAQAFESTSIIISGLAIFRIFLKERIDMKSMAVATMCVLGVILVIQPEFLFAGSNRTAQNGTDIISTANRTAQNGSVIIITWNRTTENGTKISENEVISLEQESTLKIAHSSAQLVYLGYLLAVVTGVFWSCNILILKRNPYLSEHIPDVLPWQFFFVTVLSFILMAVFETPVLPTSWNQVTYLSIHCVAYFFMWHCIMYSTKYISGNTYNLIYSTTIVGMLISQYTVLSTILPGNRNWMEVVGVVLVLLGSCIKSLFDMYSSDY